MYYSTFFSGLLLIYISYRVYGKLFNPYFVLSFPAYFALFGGTFIRRLAFDVELHINTDFLILLYLISVLFGTVIMHVLYNRFNSTRLVAKTNLNVIKYIEPYLCFISALCAAMLFTRFIEYPFSFTGFRQFYHETRASNGMGLYFYILGICLPLLVLVSFIESNYKRAIVYFFLMVFLGKKQVFFTAALFCFAYLDLFSNKPLSRGIGYLILFIMFMIIVQVLFSTADFPLLILVANYFDYYINLSHVLNWLDEHEYLFYGRILLSSLWFFIPRVLYADKPVNYGGTLIHEQVFPAELAVGYTPGTFAQIIEPVADFGVGFMVLMAVFKGMLFSFMYNYLRKSRTLMIFVLYISLFNVMYVIILLPLKIITSIKVER